MEIEILGGNRTIKATFFKFNYILNQGRCFITTADYKIAFSSTSEVRVLRNHEYESTQLETLANSNLMKNLVMI